jgi:hypothetical protein
MMSLLCRRQAASAFVALRSQHSRPRRPRRHGRRRRPVGGGHKDVAEDQLVFQR